MIFFFIIISFFLLTTTISKASVTTLQILLTDTLKETLLLPIKSFIKILKPIFTQTFPLILMRGLFIKIEETATLH